MTRVALRNATSADWLDCVLNHFDEFLIDHAANERKASSMAMSLVAHYPDRQLLVSELIELALEELNHFRQVIKIMQQRDLVMTPDEKDLYVNELRQHIRPEPDEYFLDRLLCAAVIEARGEERFTLLADNLKEASLKRFYSNLVKSEAGHHALFLQLANTYFDSETCQTRLVEWETIEATVIEHLPIRSRLH